MGNVYARKVISATALAPPFTDTCVSIQPHTGKVTGRKPESFTEAENDALRAALRDLCDRRRWKTAEAGRQLGISQQSASKLINGRGGFSRPTAEKLAELLGADGANVLVRSMGAAANPMTVPQGWGDRELAVSIARRLGYEEEVIRRVVVKFQDDQFKSRSARWWNDRVVIEAAEHQAALAAEPSPVAAPPVTQRAAGQAAQTPSRKQRKAG